MIACSLLGILLDHNALERDAGLACDAPQGPHEVRQAVPTTVPDQERDVRTLGRSRRHSWTWDPDWAVAQSGGMDVQRTRAAVLKTHLGDIPSCPCISAMLPQDDRNEQSESRGS